MEASSFVNSQVVSMSKAVPSKRALAEMDAMINSAEPQSRVVTSKPSVSKSEKTISNLLDGLDGKDIELDLVTSRDASGYQLGKREPRDETELAELDNEMEENLKQELEELDKEFEKKLRLDLSDTNYDTFEDYYKARNEFVAPYVPLWSIGQSMTNLSGPLEKRFKAINSARDQEPETLYEAIPEDVAREIKYNLKSIKSFLTEVIPPTKVTQPDGSTIEIPRRPSHPRGFHIMVGSAFLNSFLYNPVTLAGDASSMITTFDNDVHSSLLTWKYAKAIPMFVNRLFANDIVRDYNGKLSSEIEKIKEKDRVPTNHVYGRLKRSLHKNDHIFKKGEWNVLWSLEGIQKWKLTKDLKHVHAHIAIWKHTKEPISGDKGNPAASINETYWEKLKEMMLQAHPSMTITKIMSSNQLVYIAKEKALLGTTVIRGFSNENDIPANNLYTGLTSELTDLFEAHIYPAVEGVTNPFKCPVCMVFTDGEKKEFCRSWGWDQRLADFLLQNQDETMKRCFVSPGVKAPSGLEVFIEGQDKSHIDSKKRLLESALFKGFLMTQFFRSFGVTELESHQISVAMVNIWVAYFSKSRAPYYPFLQQVEAWIRANFVAASDGLSWRNVLCIGGRGGVGKTQMISCLLRGIGGNVRRLSFNPNHITRDDYKPLSLYYFYDDVHGGGLTGRSVGNSVYFNFSFFESPRTALYKTSTTPRSFELNVCTSVDINGKPTFEDYRMWAGTKEPEEKARKLYRDEIGQMSRRYTTYVFNHQEEGVLPYYRLLKGIDTELQGDRVTPFGMPLWKM